MAGRRFQKVTKGENAEVIVAKALAYTTQATYILFVANAVEGQIGIYDAATNALITTAMTAGRRYFVAQKRDGQIHKSTVITHDLARTRKVNYVAPVKQVTRINIPAGYTPVVNDDLEIGFIETTPGNEPYPQVAYDAVVTSTSQTVSALLDKIVARINNPADLQHKDDGQQYSAVKSSDGAGGFNIDVTAFYFQQHFRVILRGPLAAIGTVTYTTPFKQGVGDSDSVASIEAEGLIYSGVTTNYPEHGVPSEYGAGAAFTVSGLTYNIFHIDPLRVSKEPMPQSVHHHYAHIYIITPVPVGADGTAQAASSPDLAVSTILGV